MITQLTQNRIGVQVPEGTGEFTLRGTKHCDNGSISWYDRFTKNESLTLIPPGNWKILGLGKDLSEDQWREVVKGWSDKVAYHGSTGSGRTEYLNYVTGMYEFDENACASGLSLLRSKGLQAENTLILIKQ